MPACVESDAVTVWLPAALSVTLKTRTPLVNPVLDGKVAFASLDVIATVSLVLIKFQLASMALTVTLKATAAVWAAGVPILPVVVPGALVSPGASTCNFANAPTLTVMLRLVLAVPLPFLTSEAVNVQAPPVLNVSLGGLGAPPSAGS